MKFFSPKTALGDCDCGKPAVTIVNVRVRNADGTAIKMTLPLCLDCARLEGQEYTLPDDHNCINCGQSPIHAVDRCINCYNYFSKHGTDRPEYLYQQTFRCRTCRLLMHAATDQAAKGYCPACYKYLQIHGIERPYYLW